MKTPAQWKQGIGISYFSKNSEWQDRVQISEMVSLERHLVYWFLVAHREHAIPRQSQMLSLRLFHLFIFNFFLIMLCFIFYD